MKNIYKLILICGFLSLTNCKPPEYTVYEANFPEVSPENFVIPDLEGTAETESMRNFSGSEEKICKNLYKIGTQQKKYESSSCLYLKLVKQDKGTKILIYISKKPQNEKPMADKEAIRILLDQLSNNNPFINPETIDFEPMKRSPEKEYNDAEDFFRELCKK